MDPLKSLRLQMRLEGQAVVNGNLITQVEIVPGEDLPILLLAHLADNNLVVYYNETYHLKNMGQRNLINLNDHVIWQRSWMKRYESW